MAAKCNDKLSFGIVHIHSTETSAIFTTDPLCSLAPPLSTGRDKA